MQCQRHVGKRGCNDLPLLEFIGVKAPLQIARFLDVGLYHDKNYHGPEPENIREFTEFMRRLTIPYYDEARQYWFQAISEGYFEGENEISLFLPDRLMRMIKHYQ